MKVAPNRLQRYSKPVAQCISQSVYTTCEGQTDNKCANACRHALRNFKITTSHTNQATADQTDQTDQTEIDQADQHCSPAIAVNLPGGVAKPVCGLARMLLLANLCIYSCVLPCG